MNVIKKGTQNNLTAGSPGPFWRQVGFLVLVACAYWVAVRLGLLLVAQPEGVASIWPASGLALAVLLLNPKKQWPILLAVIFVANVVGNLSGGNSLPVSLGFALANILEALLAAGILTYFCRTKITFQTSRQIFSLFGAAIFGNGLSALLGAAVPALAFGAPFSETWLVWWSADGLGMILIAPLIVSWATNRSNFRLRKLPEIIEVVILSLALVAFAWLIFGPLNSKDSSVLRNYMVFPIVIWLAFRFNLRGMTSALTMLAVTTIWILLHGNGFVTFKNMNITEHLVNFQVFLSVLTFTGLLVNTIVAERKLGKDALKESESRYQSLVESQSDVIARSDPEGRLTFVNEAYIQAFGKEKDDLIGNSFISTVLPEDRPIVEELLADLRVPPHSKETVTRHITPQGVRWFEWVNTAILDENGNFTELQGIGRDITWRKQTEQALHSAEEFNKTIIAHSPVGISVRSRTGSLLSANAAWKTIWAISEEDYQRTLQHQFEKLQIDDSDDILKTRQQEIRRVYEQGGSLFLPDMQITNPRPGGAEWVSQHYYAILDGKSQVDRVVVLTEDISARKKVEAGKAHNQALMERAQDVAQLGTWEIDLNTNTVVASAEAHRIYGLAGELLSLADIQDSVLPEFRPMMDAELRGLIHKGQEYNVQFKIKRKSDGAIRDIHSRADYNAADNTVLGSIQDITERMLILQVVMESEEKFRTLFEHAHDAILMENEEDEILDANARACELFGYSREELLGLKISDIQAPEVRGQTGTILQNEINKFGSNLFESIDMRKDGSTFPVEISMSKVSINKGFQYVSIVRDISERKRIEQELREQIDILERFNDVTVGRELKMIELKKEINALLEEAGREKKYRIIDV